MDPIFDRFGNLIRSMFQDTESDYSQRNSNSTDTDFQDAWNELNDFLSESKTSRPRQRDKPVTKMPPLTLKKDYEILAVPFGSSFKDVKLSYKKLMTQYHPDKHAGSENDLRRATHISQKINLAYQHIKEYEHQQK